MAARTCLPRLDQIDRSASCRGLHRPGNFRSKAERDAEEDGRVLLTARAPLAGSLALGEVGMTGGLLVGNIVSIRGRRWGKARKKQIPRPAGLGMTAFRADDVSFPSLMPTTNALSQALPTIGGTCLTDSWRFDRDARFHLPF